MNKTRFSFYIISNLDFSRKSAAKTRMLHYAKALANNNNQVYILSCCSNKLSDRHFVELGPNIFLLDKMKTSKNILSAFFFLKELNGFSTSKGDEKSFLFYPTAFIFFEFLTILYLKIYKRYNVFYELNEVRKHASSYEAPMSFGKVLYSLRKIVYKIVFISNQPMLRMYNGLVCISTEIEKYGRRFNKNTLRIPILTDPDIEIATSGEKYFTEGDFNIGFSGSIHPMKEDLDNFIAVIKELKNQGYSVSFNLCGSIFKTYKQDFLKLCDLREELNYYGFLNGPEMSTFLSQQNLLVLPRGYTLQNKYGFSTKLSDYLTHRKMVLVTDISDNRLYIKEGINGFIVPPNNKKLMYEKIEYIIQNFGELEKIVIPNAINTVKSDFNYKLFGKPLRNFLKTKANT